MKKNIVQLISLCLIFVVSSSQSCEDKNGCHSFKAEISYDGIEQLTVQLTNGTAPFAYSWDQGLGSGSIAIVSGKGTYAVTVTDFNQCKAIARFTIQ